MTEEVKKDEVKEPTEEELWATVQKDRASTPAEEPLTEEPAKTEEADPLAGLPEPTRKLIEGLQTKAARFDELDARLRETNQKLATAHGTAGNLKQRLEETQARLEKVLPTIEAVEGDRKAVADAKTVEHKAARDKARASLADILDPDVVDMILPADEKPAAEAKPEPKSEPKPEVKPEPKPEPAAEDERRVLILQRELSDLAPGWMTTRGTPEFKAWAVGPGKQLYDSKADSWDVKEAASVFQAFAKHKSDAATVAQVEKDRQERLRRGESIQGRGSSTGDVDTSEDALWNKVKRDRAKAQAA